MSKKIDTGKQHVNIENVGKAAGVRVKRFAMAITLLATVAVAVVCVARAGHAQREQSQPNGEGFTVSALPAVALAALQAGVVIKRMVRSIANRTRYI